MYYLVKFCRICIQTDRKLLDIESLDYDSIKLSEKLKTCTQMVISEESLSTKICTSCIQKLRISYQFHSMCRKSTTILQHHLTELLRGCEKLDPDKFVNSESLVKLPPSQKVKRKRVGKDERCSLLRKLLSKINEDQVVENIHINGLTKLCDNLISTTPPSSTTHSKLKSTNSKSNLGNLIRFMKEFDYGYDIKNAKSICNSCDLTPLEKLKRFTNTFFFDHFSDYRNTVIQLRDGYDFDSSEDESMFEKCVDECCDTIKTENNLVQCKEELIIEEPEITIKSEIENDNECDVKDFSFTSNLVQTCYDENETTIIKREAECGSESDEFSFTSDLVQACYDENSNSSLPINFKKEKIDDSESSSPVSKLETITQNINLETDKTNFPSNKNTSNSLLSSLTLSYSSLTNCRKINKMFSPQNTRCRTRGNPFINPQLKKQFLFRSFLCEVCNRRFKSQGYLKAHKSKLRH